MLNILFFLFLNGINIKWVLSHWMIYYEICLCTQSCRQKKKKSELLCISSSVCLEVHYGDYFFSPWVEAIKQRVCSAPLADSAIMGTMAIPTSLGKLGLSFLGATNKKDGTGSWSAMVLPTLTPEFPSVGHWLLKWTVVSPYFLHI